MKNKILPIIISLFFIFCFLIFYKGLNHSSTYIPRISEKKSIPVFKAKDFYLNTHINSEDIFKKDSFYILNIWASWCIPCKKEHPLLMQLSENKSITLIGLNYRDNLNNAKNFIDELGNPYSQILIDEDGILGIEFGAYGIPETFLIDKDRMIIKKFIGPINKKNLEEIRLFIK